MSNPTTAAVAVPDPQSTPPKCPKHGVPMNLHSSGNFYECPSCPEIVTVASHDVGSQTPMEFETWWRVPTEIKAVQWFPDRSVAGVYLDPEYNCPSRDGGQMLTQPIARYYVVDCRGIRQYLEPGVWVVQELDRIHHYPVIDPTFRKLYARHPSIGYDAAARANAEHEPATNLK